MVALARVLTRTRRALGPSSPITRRHFTAGPSGGLRRQIEPVDFAFAFDIDGVLARKLKPLRGAVDTLKYLHYHRIPYIMLTNGGGQLETIHAAHLTTRFGFYVEPNRMIQSHTPFLELASGQWDVGIPGGMHDKTVFVTGSKTGDIRGVMHSYGFKNVVTTADIINASPNIYPHDPLLRQAYHANFKPLPAPIWTPSHPAGTAPLRIDAIFVLNDPRDWAIDIQIITDLLSSDGGILGRPRKPSSGPAPRIYYSNPDLVWATNYHRPRLGQGAFHAAVDAVWTRFSGGAPADIVTIGKPSARTYQFAERVLEKQSAWMHDNYGSAPFLAHSKIDALGAEAGDATKTAWLKRVYMIGDNPESDVRGANEFQSPQGTEWKSILVKTGVWKENDKPSYKPTKIVDNVKAAVEWALKKEGFQEWEVPKMPGKDMVKVAPDDGEGDKKEEET